MDTKDEILRTLEENRGRYVSGESISRAVGVSRQSVWKAVKALGREGYEIESSTRKGYRLSGRCDILSAAVISSETGAVVYCYDEVTSTNDVAKQIFYREGPCLVVADMQTEGRRKNGETFPSPASGGVYMTVAERFRSPVSETGKARERIAGGVLSAIRGCLGSPAEIRDGDDVYAGGRRACGILSEFTFCPADGRCSAAFVGVGVYTGGSSPTLEYGALKTGESRNRLISGIYRAVEDSLRDF